MRSQAHRFILVTALFIACASPKPVLYPNSHYQLSGAEVAGRAIDECLELAHDTAAGGAIGSASGAVGGAVVGHPGRGAMVGAAAGATG